MKSPKKIHNQFKMDAINLPRGADGGAFRFGDLTVIASWGEGWDHVSVSREDRCPTWEEMCYVKRLFFKPSEVVLQYHPPESEYVNAHPNCLHLWRPQDAEIPLPPVWMV